MAALRHILPAVVLAAVFLGGWEGYVRLTAVSPLVLPAPSDVLNGLRVEGDDISRHALATVGVASLGFGLSVSFALVVSVALHFAGLLRRGVMPLLVASQTVPIVALAPLMVLWFGFGLLPKVLLVILVTFFPMVVSLMTGYGQVPHAFRDQLVSMGAGPWQVFRRATLPSARAHFFAGLRISATYAIVATIFAEYAGARQGLGIYILTAKNNFRADLVLSAVAVSALLTLTLLALIQGIERATGHRYRRSTHA
ncbi:permease protein of ABC transporter [Oceanicola granulosus HTCC2516]|uniref:Permease protein of ABC transporter n=1 Tax=Oceanicola granulosus (strain ATCC BAA-861 / DSM 15982 / KCTC 12143 / HTCC2516) TaxID=314256 RepID=Q2CH19_OCEGH|nr:ABC transporter permease [Oceanicola granulosus]EAR51992.1 permease protein of ABC transporter [Oceanicola granulosus HTCC2516]